MVRGEEKSEKERERERESVCVREKSWSEV
jgi:hypothetical protein